MALEKHYSGDDAWKRFFQYAINNPLSGEVFNQDAFPNYENLSPAALAILQTAVAYYGVDRTKKWLEVSLPALEGKAPKDCLFASDDSSLQNRIREYLMRLQA